MSTTTAPNTERQRSNARADQERSERRRRQDTGSGRLDMLSIVGERDPNYVYRWVNDTPGRLHQLTQMDDWDVVSDIGRDERDKSLGTGSERVVDRRTGLRAVLVKKRKDYYADDQAKQQAAIAETEADIRRGRASSPDGLQGPTSYVPAGGIVIQNGSKSSTYTP